MPLFGKKGRKQTSLPKEVLLKSRVVKNPRVVSEKREDGTVVLKIKREHSSSGGLFSGLFTSSGEKKIVLDEIGSYVWELIEKEATVERLVEALVQKFSLHWKEAETSLLVFLNMLLSRGLISLRAPKTLGKER